MVKQYSKIAIWQELPFGDYFTPPYSEISKYTKKMNCDFQIKRFFIFYKRIGAIGKAVAMDSEDFKEYNSPAEGEEYVGPKSKLYVKNKDEIVWEVDNSDKVYYNLEITKIIALS